MRLAAAGAALLGAVVASATTSAPGNATALDQPGRIAKVDLSFANSDIVFTDATHWTVPIRPVRGSQPGACRGEYVVPEITAGPGNGTSVRYGVKYFCTEPVQYTIVIGVYELDSQSKATANRARVDQRNSSGVSQNPHLEGNTPPCRSNRNSGWLPWDTTNIKGQTKTAEAQVVTTVGCTMK